jgi:hypothetical protein
VVGEPLAGLREKVLHQLSGVLRVRSAGLRTMGLDIGPLGIGIADVGREVLAAQHEE